eukprot:CFRG4725T1
MWLCSHIIKQSFYDVEVNAQRQRHQISLLHIHNSHQIGIRQTNSSEPEQSGEHFIAPLALTANRTYSQNTQTQYSEQQQGPTYQQYAQHYGRFSPVPPLSHTPSVQQHSTPSNLLPYTKPLYHAPQYVSDMDSNAVSSENNSRPYTPVSQSVYNHYEQPQEHTQLSAAQPQSLATDPNIVQGLQSQLRMATDMLAQANKKLEATHAQHEDTMKKQSDNIERVEREKEEAIAHSNTLRKELAELQASYERAIADTKGQLNDTVLSTEGRTEQLFTELETATTALANAQDRLDTLVKENTTLVNEKDLVVRDAQIERQRLAAEIREVQETFGRDNEGLKIQLSAVQESAETLATELEEARRQIGELENEQDERENEWRNERAALTSVNESTGDDVKHAHEALKRERAEWESERAQWEEERSSIANKCSAKEDLIADLQKQVEFLTADAEAHKSTSEHLENVGRMLSEEANNTEQTNLHAKCQSVMKHLTLEIGRTNQDHQHETSSLNKQIAELQTELNEKANLVATVKSNAQTLAKVNAQKKDLTNQLQELQDRFISVTTAQMDLATEVESLRYTNSQLANELSEYKREMDGEDVMYIDPAYVQRLCRSEKSLAGQIVRLQKAKVDLESRVHELTSTPTPPSAPTSTLTPKHADIHMNTYVSTVSDSGADVSTDGNVDESVRENEPEASPRHGVPSTPTPILETPILETQLEAEREIEKPVDVNSAEIKNLKDQIAALKTEKTELEKNLAHERSLVEQLNDETATIPTYISLFHQQRKALQDSYSKKDAELTRLSQLLVSHGVKIEPTKGDSQEISAAPVLSFDSPGTPVPAVPVV